jgi:predicted site-specific integrase-resolvase
MMPARKNSPQRDQWLDEIVPLKEAASLRSVSYHTLLNLVRQKRLKAIKLSLRKLGMTRREAMKALASDPQQ